MRRWLALLLLVCLLLFTTHYEVLAYAPGQAKYVSYGNMNYSLNCYTSGTPTNGTTLNAYWYSGSSTQTWDLTSWGGSSIYARMLSNANHNVAISYVGATHATVNSITNDASIQKIKLIQEGYDSNNYYREGLANVTYLLALTCSGYYNGAQIQWLSSNGLNNQLWVVRVW